MKEINDVVYNATTQDFIYEDDKSPGIVRRGNGVCKKTYPDLSKALKEHVEKFHIAQMRQILNNPSPLELLKSGYAKIIDDGLERNNNGY